jgi:hypothetical protein
MPKLDQETKTALLAYNMFKSWQRSAHPAEIIAECTAKLTKKEKKILARPITVLAIMEFMTSKDGSRIDPEKCRRELKSAPSEDKQAIIRECSAILNSYARVNPEFFATKTPKKYRGDIVLLKKTAPLLVAAFKP